ncbi:MAG: sulfotransferase family protein [Chitinophagales bacterium]|nr:MAG: sulfotransferase family protein [Chitinophagales bacterium]
MPGIDNFGSIKFNLLLPQAGVDIQMNIPYGPRAYFNFRGHPAFGSSLQSWLKLLWRYRSEIALPFLPKIMYITLIILLSTPVRLYEQLRYNKKIWRYHLRAPVFILGYPRSGTTYLHYLLSADCRFGYCAVLESFMPWIFLSSEKLLKKIMSQSLPVIHPMDNLKLHATSPSEEEMALFCMGEESMITGYVFPKKIYSCFKKYVLFQNKTREILATWKSNLAFFMQKLCYKNEGRPLLMKNSFHIGRVRELLEMFPDAKFIHIYRNPYAVYAANVQLYEKMLPVLSFHEADVRIIEDFILRSYSDIFRKYNEDKKSIPPKNLIEFSYEEFTDNPLQTLERIYNQLNLGDFDRLLPVFEKALAESAGYHFNSYTPDPELKDKVYAAWKPYFEAMGYAS